MTGSTDTMTASKLIEKIREICQETLNRKPTYGDTKEDVTRLEGEQALAEQIISLITE